MGMIHQECKDYSFKRIKSYAQFYFIKHFSYMCVINMDTKYITLHVLAVYEQTESILDYVFAFMTANAPNAVSAR